MLVLVMVGLVVLPVLQMAVQILEVMGEVQLFPLLQAVQQFIVFVLAEMHKALAMELLPVVPLALAVVRLA
jgi:hypothetical protein